ncbi:MAG: DNA-directed RNA polymerase subunit beta [Agromyces sp.]
MSDSSGLAGQFRPVKRPNEVFEHYWGGDDPAVSSRIAHESAAALLARVRDNADPAVVTRLAEFADEQGTDAIAELWAQSSPRSLPGALWRVYVIRAFIVQQAEPTALAFERGRAVSPGIDPVVAGSALPAGPDEIRTVADEILHGVFQGDFAGALERAAAFARVCSAGYVDFAHDSDADSAERARSFTVRAARLATIAEELTSCARLWRAGSLD